MSGKSGWVRVIRSLLTYVRAWFIVDRQPIELFSLLAKLKPTLMQSDRGEQGKVIDDRFERCVTKWWIKNDVDVKGCVILLGAVPWYWQGVLFDMDVKGCVAVWLCYGIESLCCVLVLEGCVDMIWAALQSWTKETSPHVGPPLCRGRFREIILNGFSSLRTHITQTHPYHSILVRVTFVMQYKTYIML